MRISPFIEGYGPMTREAGAGRALRAAKPDLQKFVMVGVLVVIMAAFAIATPKFLTYVNLENVFMQVALILLTGSAATLLMISGNFDLSVGSVVAFTGVMHALMSKYGVPTLASICLAAVLGGICGLVNGTLVTRLKITPVIATLGMMYVARGAAFLVARADGGANIASGLPRNFQGLGRAMIGPIPLPLLLVAIVVALFVIIQTRTRFGRHAFAIGGNIRCAILSGVKASGVVTILYAATGLLTGLSGAILVSRIGTGVPRIGNGFEFDVIIAMVLGGTSIYGGEGSVIGTVIGALIVGFVANGLNLLDVQSFYQTVIKGFILVAAILLDRKIKERLS
jgi:ribose/xylose/arabinose/galactoside ABC-type transport system permease subunit